MQCTFSEDPGISRKLFDLLEVVFPGIRQGAESIRSLGVSWESASTPFIRCENTVAVSHVGVIEIPLILLGNPTAVGSIHGVATHPEYRNRGYYREVMEEALEYCATRYRTQILTTEHPAYFTPFGFRIIQEHFFCARVSSGGGENFRRLNTANAGDIALLLRLIEKRAPVSNIVGVIREKAVFCFNEGRRPIFYAENLDSILCMEREGNRMHIYDIVGPKIPDFELLLACLPRGIEELFIHFSPELLGIETEAKPYIFDHNGPSYLMVRGPFPAEGKKFTLPRSART